jgi:adenosylcobinamide-GDP ribazoletransferase
MVLIVPTLAVSAVALWLVVGVLASAMAWLVMLRWFARRLQGFTGDCLGATQQVCELAFYLSLALAWGAVTRGGLV